MSPDEQTREAHRVLLAMNPDERTVALAAATIEGHHIVRQIVRLIALVEVMGQFLDETERVALADVVDSAIRLVTRWH